MHPKQFVAILHSVRNSDNILTADCRLQTDRYDVKASTRWETLIMSGERIAEIGLTSCLCLHCRLCHSQMVWHKWCECLRQNRREVKNHSLKNKYSTALHCDWACQLVQMVHALQHTDSQPGLLVAQGNYCSWPRDYDLTKEYTYIHILSEL